MNAFCLLCATLSLAVLFLATAAGALLSNFAAWLFWHLANRDTLLRFPKLIFLARVFPITFGVLITLGFALPSFLLLEPHHSVEAPEHYLIAVAVLALAGIVVLIARCARLVFLSRSVVREWLRTAELLPISSSIPVYQIPSPESLVAIVGIRRPKVFVGKCALASLTGDELKAALAHELAHVSSLDNLKQFVLRITRLPRFFTSLRNMDRAWSTSAELLADANALKSGTSVLELSSAIIKVGRLKAAPMEPLAVAACHLIPPDGSSSALAMRIRHLHSMLETHPEEATNESNGSLGITLLAAIFGYFLLLPSALPVVHRWMEWLAR